MGWLSREYEKIQKDTNEWLNADTFQYNVNDFKKLHPLQIFYKLSLFGCSKEKLIIRVTSRKDSFVSIVLKPKIDCEIPKWLLPYCKGITNLSQLSAVNYADKDCVDLEIEKRIITDLTKIYALHSNKDLETKLENNSVVDEIHFYLANNCQINDYGDCQMADILKVDKEGIHLKTEFDLSYNPNFFERTKGKSDIYFSDYDMKSLPNFDYVKAFSKVIQNRLMAIGVFENEVNKDIVPDKDLLLPITYKNLTFGTGPFVRVKTSVYVDEQEESVYILLRYGDRYFNAKEKVYKNW